MIRKNIDTLLIVFENYKKHINSNQLPKIFTFIFLFVRFDLLAHCHYLN